MNLGEGFFGTLSRVVGPIKVSMKRKKDIKIMINMPLFQAENCGSGSEVPKIWFSTLVRIVPGDYFSDLKSWKSVEYNALMLYFITLKSEPEK